MGVNLPPPVVIEYVQPRCPHVEELEPLIASVRAKGVLVYVVNALASPQELASVKALGVRETPTLAIGGSLYTGDAAASALKELLRD